MYASLRATRVESGRRSFPFLSRPRIISREARPGLDPGGGAGFASLAKRSRRESSNFGNAEDKFRVAHRLRKHTVHRSLFKLQNTRAI